MNMQKKIGVSRSCFFNYKEQLEDAGAIIEYSRMMKQYIYMNEFEFEMKVTYSEISSIEMNIIKGGIKNIFSVHYFRLKEYIFAIEN